MKVGEFFLGKVWHWLLVAGVILVLSLAGGQKLHVTQFNLFVTGLISMSTLIILLVLKFSRPGDRLTRDPLPGSDDQTD